MNSEKFKIVILKCPYDCWESNPDVPYYFSEMIGLKLRGYKKEYRYGVLPVDSSDYIAEHILFCKEEGGKSRVVSAVKTLPFDYCQLFHVPFSVETFLRNTQSLEHLNKLHEIIHHSEKENRRLCYYSSWTIDPAVREDREATHFIKKLFIAATVFHHIESGLNEMVGLGVPKFKTDKFFEKFGLAPVPNTSNILLPDYNDAEVIMMHMKEFSQDGLRAAAEFRDIWDKRTTYGRSDINQKERLLKVA